jgi:V/A-type H+-transporting ATPase subunit D
VSRIPTTKHELKRQRDALARYERFLPTLRLKQRQLQMELRRVEAAVREVSEDEARVRHEVGAWIEVWAEPQPLARLLELGEVRTGETSVAGVTLPTLESVAWRRHAPSLAATPPWVDDALLALERLAELRLRRRVLVEQRSRLSDELRRTRQRVNLFEKVKIPEATAALRFIRIALGDLQAADVVRAKIAKAKGVEREQAA